MRPRAKREGYNARFYDAQLARFISADTLVPEPGSVKAYDRFSYSNNNPINYTDPSGHSATVCSPGDACGGTSIDMGTNYSVINNWASYGLGAFIQFANDITFGAYYALIGGEPSGENKSFQEGRRAGRVLSTAISTTLITKGTIDTATGLASLGASIPPALACAGVTLGSCSVVAAPVLAGEGALVLGGIAEGAWGTGILTYIQKNPLTGNGSGNPAQWKRLSPSEIRKLEEYYSMDVESIKSSGGNNAGHYELFKDGNGNVYIKPKGGSGPGEYTRYNLNEIYNK